MSAPALAIDRHFIERYSDLYLANAKQEEKVLFERVGPTVALRGHYTKAELLQVGAWKTKRVKGRLDSNSEDDVVELTRIALAAPLRLRHRLLCLLNGVQRPVASALLTVWNPAEHTILDINAVSALHRLDPSFAAAKVADVSYMDYLTKCNKIVAEVGGVSLRDLDRALWKWWDMRERR